MIEKAYDPKPVEARWRERWVEGGLFSSTVRGEGKPVVVVIPPPNVTGALHCGHALNNALQDIIIRHHKLLGRETCWVPGADHGGIATQNVMEKQLRAEGKNRTQFSRADFIDRMMQWSLSCKETILGQLRALGCGLDWKREAFTMDETRAKAVNAAFEALWIKGLIYRGERMVNWCVRCGTALSDIEVEHEERKGHLWHIRYPGADGSEGVVVATTRPETMLGDTAVAVHPEDKRYKDLIGRKLRLPLMDRDIPVVADEMVDSSFGTGAVKVTPAHDVNDYEVWRRHPGVVGAPIKVIGPDGKMTAEAKSYEQLSREVCRDKVVEDLASQGFLTETADHRNSVGVCYRCSQVIEPLLSWQWFVKQAELAQPALKALEEGRFKIYPESWSKAYREWLVKIKDWCISRQIWWGHQIPVWYCRHCNPEPKIWGGGHPSMPAYIADAKGFFSVERPGPCPDCGGKDWVQDPDVLDTWFSSALWPFSVFGWPEKTKDLSFYYPTTVLVTGYEIIYLWVARMQMMGLALMGEVPFPHALIHGIVRDKKGKKMSKSLGNVIDPLDMMAKFGTDALRFSLAAQAHPGRDIPFAEESLTGARNFSNKMWNSARFVLMNLPESAPPGCYPLSKLSHGSLELSDRWILSEYQAVLALVKEKMESYEIAAAADALYGFFWDKFCDWYVELAKIRLQGEDGETKEAARTIMVTVLVGTLKALHPIMPFITEELYAALKPYVCETEEFLLQAGYPRLESDWSNPDAARDMGSLIETVVALRTLRAQLNVPPGLKIRVLASGGSAPARALVRAHLAYLKTLARIEEFTEPANGDRPRQSATALAAGVTFYVPLEGLIDFEVEKKRLSKDLDKISADLIRVDAKLSNPDFISRAKEAEVRSAREQQQALLAKKAKLSETLSDLA